MTWRLTTILEVDNDMQDIMEIHNDPMEVD
jgi:hypothetical protein